MNIEILKKAKQQKKYTNAYLSQVTGIPVGTINKIMCGQTKSIKADNYKKLCDVLTLDEKIQTSDNNYGFIKCAACTFEGKVADVGYNVDKICEKIDLLVGKGVKLIVFPELSVSLYTCSDLFYQQTLLSETERGILKIAERSKYADCLIFVGAPIRKDGKLYNCAVTICKGEILGVVPKSFIPNYNEFYEARYFAPAPENTSTVKIGDKEYPFGTKIIFAHAKNQYFKVACEICEDLWTVESPSIKHCLAGATAIVNLSASDEVIGKAEYRKKLVSIQSAKNACAYLYSNAGIGESTTDMVYSGHSFIYENGRVLSESKPFSMQDAVADIDFESIEFERSKHYLNAAETSGYLTVNFDVELPFNIDDRSFNKTPFVPQNKLQAAQRANEILEMQSYGLYKRIKHTNCKTLVLGVSGGLDSSLALIVCVRALSLLNRSAKDLIAVTMPCFGTTQRTKGNAEKMSVLLGATLLTVDIKNAVDVHLKDIGHDGKTHDITYENAQARERTQVLMDVANRTGGMVIGTGDLSELALGWATYNGDHMSMYAVNASIPKTLIKCLISYEADRLGGEIKKVLYDVLNTPVSPELIPAVEGKISQITEDIVGPYELHDFFLYQMLRHGYSPSKIYTIAIKTFKGEYDEKTIYKWLDTFVRRFFAQQFKRSCLPDGVKVGTITLSPRGDWRMPSDASREIWLKDLQSVNPDAK